VDRRAELEAAYARIVGEVPAEAAVPIAALVTPFVAPASSYDTVLPPPAALDWRALLADQVAADALLAVLAALDAEEEDAVLALLMA